MDWYTVESDTMPQDEETQRSKVYNYIRRNIRTEQRTDEESGNTYTVYVCEEMKIPKDQWSLYKAQEQQSADIDYLLMITEDL